MTKPPAPARASFVLGGNVFGWTIDRETSFAVLDAYVAGGGWMIDTADRYSAWVPGHAGGESETIIGAWLARRGRRDDVRIATKVGLHAGAGGDGLAPTRIAAAITESLARLHTDHVDVYYAHKDDPRQEFAAVEEAFGRLVDAGQVRSLGASNFTPERLRAALDHQAASGAEPYRALQNEYSLVRRHDYESAMQELCVARGVAMFPYYGLASGFLTGKYRRPSDFGEGGRQARAQTYFDDRGLRVLEALDSVAAETGATAAQVALAWLAAQPGIAAPLVSVTSVRQLEELQAASALTLAPEQFDRLDRASAE